jgi:hypothetical protein
MKTIKRIALALAPVAVAAGVVAGAGAAHAAVYPTVTDFHYTVNSAVLTSAAGDVTPGNGQAVKLDLTAAVVAAGVATGDVPGDVTHDVATLEAAGLPVTAVTTASNGDTLISLFAVNSHAAAHTFGLAFTAGGTAIVVPDITVGDVHLTGGNAELSWLRYVAPYVYRGHVIDGTNMNGNAQVGWSDSTLGWPSPNHCVEVYMYGFDTPAGTAHVGFTCNHGNPAANIGYLRGLTKGHSVSLFVRPATGTYLHHHPIPGTDARAHVYVVAA